MKTKQINKVNKEAKADRIRSLIKRLDSESLNIQTGLILFFVPLITAGILSLIYAIITGAVNVNFL